MPHPPAWFPRTTFLSVKRASVTERIFLQVWWQFSQSVVSPFPSFGKEGWLKAGVVGGYTMLIITDLRIHLPPPPTGTPPSRRRRMEIPPTINCQVIILPIHLIIKFFFLCFSVGVVSKRWHNLFYILQFCYIFFWLCCFFLMHLATSCYIPIISGYK